MLTLLWISLPFAIVAAVLFVLSQKTGGWDGLGWAIWWAVAMGAWAVVVLGYFVWLMSRDGLFVWYGLPLAVFVVLAVAGAFYGGRLLLDHARCEADKSFYTALAAAPLSDRAAMVADGAGKVTKLSDCGRDYVELYFMSGKYDEPPAHDRAEADRIATVAILFEGGMPPDERFLWRAVDSGDVAFTELLLARRMVLADAGDEAYRPVVPDRIADHALMQLEMDPGSVYHQHADRYLAILRLMFEAGLDPCRSYGTGTYRDEMARKGVPADIMAMAGPGCG